MGTAEGAAKARKKALAKNPNHFMDMASKGGRSSAKENRAFYRDRDLAKRAGIASGRLRRKRKLEK